MRTDLVNLTNAVVAAGGGANLAIIAAPRQAMILNLVSGLHFDVPVITGPSLPAGTVIMLDLGALVTSFSDVPRIEVGKDALIHWDDTPVQIGTAGTPNVVAAPSRSGAQVAVYAIKVVLRGAWGLRAPAVAWVSAATW